MAIRITGMYSGLDTESIINELASAQSAKKNKLVKAQTKLSWKQDAWKSLNTKLYDFYRKLDDLRLQSSYIKKKTTVSNSNILSVSGGTMDGTHKVSVNKLSTQASITSGSLANGTTHYTGKATLKQLGFSGTGSIRLSDPAGNYVNIDVDENMKINDFVKAIEDKTALKANYDQENQRIYISSTVSGKNGDFFLTGNDAGGMEALKALKLVSSNDLESLTAAGGEYAVWANYVNTDITGASPTYSSANYTAEYKKLIEKETLKRLQAMKAENDKLTKENEDLDKANQKNLDLLKEISENKDHKYDAYQTYISGFNGAWDKDNAADQAAIKNAGEALYNKIYGTDTGVQDTDEKGNPKVDKDGNPVNKRAGGLTQELESAQEDLKNKKEALEQARKDLAAGTGSQAAVDQAEKDVVDASKAVSDKQSEITKAKEVYSCYSAFDQNLEKKTANETKIAANDAKFKYTKNADGTETYEEKDASGTPVAIGQGEVSKAVAAEFDKRVAEAQAIMKDVRGSIAGGALRDPGTGANQSAMLAAAQGTKVSGEDAEIVMDGVKYTSSTDTLTINGVTITALETTDPGKEVTVSTKTDTEGVYDMIKDFIKSYSDLVIEMDSLYNAESSSGYEPLLSEEKDALSDSEIEEWEKKIKDSILRRDATLGDLSSSMRMDMMFSMEIGGRRYSLADFGIETQSYFKAKDNERNAYHILGDKDDPLSWEQTEGGPTLLGMIEKDPEKVVEFFTGLSTKLHDTLQAKMAPSKMSSALTFYNDKKMKEDYDDYTKKIKDQETKLNSYIDKWYAKFSAMETALAKLESKNNSLSSLFGG